jgi:radical SAM superfamily enzyme YgiQ (UPF0313 family)
MTILELVEHLLARGNGDKALYDIPGLRLRGQNGDVIATSPRPFISNLDDLPFPARDLVDMETYRSAWLRAHGYWSLSIMHTRGCPYACTWCQKAVFGRTYRSRSAANAAQEMRQIKEAYQPDRVRVVDDVTGIGRRWLLEWRDALVTQDAIVPFECLSRANLISEEVLRTLKEAGAKRIFFGAESGSQRVLDGMNKEITVQQIHETARLCREIGIETHFYMMVGYPGEEWEDLKLSVGLLRETRPDEFSTTIAYPLPGTEFYEQVRDRMGFADDCVPDWTHSAENRLLFHRGRYNTWFYRRVVRWFHNEWKNAWLQSGKRVSPTEWLKTKMGLWRDRLLVYLSARLPNLVHTRFFPTPGS